MIGRVVAVGYVATVAVLTAVSFWDVDREVWPAEITAAVLGLPLVLPALPFIYVLGAVAWNVSDSDSGGPMWPVTLTFTSIMTVVAVGNVLLVRAASSRRARTRSGA